MRVALASVLVCVLARTAAAIPATGRLVGRVLDPDGPFAGATVLVESAEVARTVTSNRAGSFAIDDLLPGRYRVTASAEDRAGGAAEVTVGDGDEAAVIVTVGPHRELPRPAGPTRGEGLAGLPLWSRSPAAALRLSLASRGRAGGRARFGAAQGNPEWRLEGFDFTHPVTGAPAVAVGLEALVNVGPSEGGPGHWGVGPLADPVSRSGSNRWDAGAVGIVGLTAGSGDGELAGPLEKDRLWFVLSQQARTQAGEPASGRTFGKLTWQVGPRNKATLLGALALRQPESSRASFGGLKWESVARDDLILTFHLATISDAGTAVLPAVAMQAGRAKLDLFLDRDGLGEHALTLTAGGALIAVDRPGGRASANRGYAGLEETWRPSRHLTLAGSVGRIAAQELDGTVAGTSGMLAATWDATGDGRTAVRLRASSILVPGLLAVACPDCPRATRLREAAAGMEREVVGGSAAGLEVLLRRARLDGNPPADEREALLALHLNHHRRAYKVTAMYQGRLGPARGELLGLGSLGLTPWLSAGALAIYAPRSTWASLFEETRAGLLAPAPGPSAWLLGLQLHAELGAFVGVRSAVWLDALNLTGDRGAVALAGSTPIAAPPRQLRLGLQVDY